MPEVLTIGFWHGSSTYPMMLNLFTTKEESNFAPHPDFIVMNSRLNKNQFIACLSSGKFNQHIAESIKDAMNSGALGTPYGVLIGPNGQKSVIAGALSYSETKEKIDEMLK